MDYCKKTILELKEICSQHKIKGITGKKKNELIEMIKDYNLKKSNLEEANKQTIAQPLSDTNILHTQPSYLSISELINKLTLGDCIEFMKKLPSNSIDMVCTDPPYFLDGLNSDWNKKTLDKKGSSVIVGNLPKGMKFDRNQSKKFNEFYSLVSIEVFRILKPGGSFLSFSSPRLYHSMAMAIEDAGFEIRDMLGWIYTQSQVKAFSQDHIIDNDKNLSIEQKAELKNLCKDWKTPQLKPAIEPICFAVKPIEGRYIDNFKKYGLGLMNTSEETKTGIDYFPSNIVITENISQELDTVFLVAKPKKIEKGDYNTHLSVKPVSLISHLIKLFTKEGAIILDPFMGSGTTAVSCIHTKRNYIGVELNSEYVSIAEKRIIEALV
jgi:site-specific DNA-methyltransferase (adenine-specific)